MAENTTLLAKRTLSIGKFAKRAIARHEGTDPLYIGNLVGIATGTAKKLDREKGDTWVAVTGNFAIQYSDGSTEAAKSLSSPNLVTEGVISELDAGAVSVEINCQLWAVPSDCGVSDYEWRTEEPKGAAMKLPAFARPDGIPTLPAPTKKK